MTDPLATYTLLCVLELGWYALVVLSFLLQFYDYWSDHIHYFSSFCPSLRKQRLNYAFIETVYPYSWFQEYETYFGCTDSWNISACLESRPGVQAALGVEWVG